jgi:hypothetical protein
MITLFADSKLVRKSLNCRVFRNFADTEFRMFFSIPCIPLTIRNRPKFRGIMRNSVLWNSSNSAEFRNFYCNEIPYNCNFINCTGQASIIGWREYEMAEFKGTVLRDFFIMVFFIKQLLVLLDIGISIFFEFLFSRSYMYL